jgi:hypothetical protein
MSDVKTQQQIGDIKKRVQALLNARLKRRKFRLRVADEVRQQDEWLYLIVAPDRKGVSTFDYADALSDVELKLRQDEHVENVLLVPALDE